MFGSLAPSSPDPAACGRIPPTAGHARLIPHGAAPHTRQSPRFPAALPPLTFPTPPEAVAHALPPRLQERGPGGEVSPGSLTSCPTSHPPRRDPFGVILVSRRCRLGAALVPRWCHVSATSAVGEHGTCPALSRRRRWPQAVAGNGGVGQRPRGLIGGHLGALLGSPLPSVRVNPPGGALGSRIRPGKQDSATEITPAGYSPNQ